MGLGLDPGTVFLKLPHILHQTASLKAYKAFELFLILKQNRFFNANHFIPIMKNVLVIGLFSITALTFASCGKDKENVRLNVRLTDGPGDYQQVNVDIREIRIKMADDTTQWLLLNTNAGIYDLLTLQNGVDTLLATGNVPPAVLKEVRFVLGDDNSIMVDSVLHPLETPSAQESGLKIKVDKDLNLDINTLTFDFDAAQSILETGNGQYKLKPVIRVK